jgi:hypothetical protein
MGLEMVFLSDGFRCGMTVDSRSHLLYSPLVVSSILPGKL